MKKQEPSRQRHKSKNEITISRLSNSIYYFLDYVFIIFSEKEYRLVILHHDLVIMDAYYNTLRGAKIAFAKFFSEKTWEENVQPQWSQTYQPDHDWLEEKLEILNRHSQNRSDS